MNRTGKVITAVTVCICAVAVIALAVTTIAGADEKMGMEKGMHKGDMKCAMTCQKNMEDLSSAMMSLDAAIKAIDAGDNTGAKADIEKARGMLADVKMSIEKCMAQMPVVNEKCPITGKSIDKMNVPADLTQMYKGMKIGFCCPACPPAWDKLTDTEKDAKLKDVVPRHKMKEKTKDAGESMMPEKMK